MTETVAVIDYGMGNLHSAGKALEKEARADQRIVISADPDVIAAADRVVFPGVGAIRDCIQALSSSGMDQAIHGVIQRGTPLLGICVGMQALMAHSEENGGIDALGVFDGKVQFFGHQTADNGARLKVPHMGWNQVSQRPHFLWQNIDDYSRFYFVHSYCVTGLDDQQVIGGCEYGVPFAAAVGRDNVVAVQFHPEKSATAGLALLHNFLRWQP